MKNFISPSLLSCDFSKMGEEVERLQKCGADWLHIDVMDAHFVPNLTLGAPVIKALRSHATLPFDVHLMMEEPLKYLDDFTAAGADIITFHSECSSSISDTISAVKAKGLRVGLSIKPGTPAQTVFEFLPLLDMVLVMTVEPGFGGQAFIPECLAKIEEIRKECDRLSLETDIQVDGGINDETIILAAAAGANVFVAGSAVFRAEDTAAAISRLRSAADNAE